MSAREVPPGCMEVPGIILELEGGGRWIAQDGQITADWRQRGVWSTEDEAQSMLDRVFPDSGKEAK